MALGQAVHTNLEHLLHSAGHYQLISELMESGLLCGCVPWPGSPVSEEGLVSIPGCLLPGCSPLFDLQAFPFGYIHSRKLTHGHGHAVIYTA